MRYYSKKVFYFVILLNVLATITTVITAYCLFFLSGMGCSMGCPENYVETVIGQLLPLTFGIVLFLFFSIIFLFLQQYKNYRFGYLTLITVPFYLYISYKILPSMINFIYLFFEKNKGISGIDFVIIIFLIILLILVILIPFYVLGRLIKEDFFKKNKN